METEKQLQDTEFWQRQMEDLKQDLSDFARPKGATTTERLQHRWEKLCTHDAKGERGYKSYTLAPHQTARVEFALYGLETMTNLAAELAQENARLRKEIAQGPQGTVDRLIAYLDPDTNKRSR